MWRATERWAHGGNNGAAMSAEGNSPFSVVVDSTGVLYIADYGNNTIRRVSNGVITTVAGTGTAGFSGDGGPAINAELNGPTGLSLDSAGNLYVVDSNNSRVRKITIGIFTTGIITTVAATARRDSAGDSGPATSAAVDVSAKTSLSIPRATCTLPTRATTASERSRTG